MYAHGLGFEVNDGFDGHGHGHGHGDFSGCMLGNTKHQTPNTKHQTSLSLGIY
jgi:hypothetical protein